MFNIVYIVIMTVNAKNGQFPHKVILCYEQNLSPAKLSLEIYVSLVSFLPYDTAATYVCALVSTGEVFTCHHCELPFIAYNRGVITQYQCSPGQWKLLLKKSLKVSLQEHVFNLNNRFLG